MSDFPGRPDNEKEWRLIEKLVLSLGVEQRRARRWGIFFKLLTFAYLFFVVMLLAPSGGHTPAMPKEGFTAVVDVQGVIAADEVASAENIIAGLRDAFEADGVKAVVLNINSPGGSPVQSGYVYDEIMRLKGLHEIPVYAVIADLGASGAYYIAAAADYIYADKASLVGSIGVIGSGFGFVGAMDKLGIERRQYTSGEHKGFLDPFSPVNPQEKAFWEGVLNKTHQQFIAQVKRGRGERLKETQDMFSGLIWTGEQALEFGLIDALGSVDFVAREVVGAEELVNFTPQDSPFESLVSRLGASMGKSMASAAGITASGLQLR